MTAAHPHDQQRRTSDSLCVQILLYSCGRSNGGLWCFTHRRSYVTPNNTARNVEPQGVLKRVLLGTFSPRESVVGLSDSVTTQEPLMAQKFRSVIVSEERLIRHWGTLEALRASSNSLLGTLSEKETLFVGSYIKPVKIPSEQQAKALKGSNVPSSGASPRDPFWKGNTVLPFYTKTLTVPLEGRPKNP